MRRYRINEIFYSLQGEGAHTGRPAAFVRFSGCNLHCPFCDTDFRLRATLTADEILRQLQPHPARFVVLTGGEPALQADGALVDALHRAGYTIAIETNGTRPLPDGIDWVTLSPKEEGEVVLTRADELKVVYVGQDVERYADAIHAPVYYLQPCAREENGLAVDNREAVVDYCLHHPRWRLSLQTHKILHIR
ncbi:MAG: hypothetical protein AUK63_1472 [bacterium P3]|nr:MAG: hypothetical protein AUK63_1472 [bacterium P3]KWW40034.1 MAG: hypothetical protein F083_1756 [bacterium F083]